MIGNLSRLPEGVGHGFGGVLDGVGDIREEVKVRQVFDMVDRAFVVRQVGNLVAGLGLVGAEICATHGVAHNSGRSEGALHQTDVEVARIWDGKIAGRVVRRTILRIFCIPIAVVKHSGHDIQGVSIGRSSADNLSLQLGPQAAVEALILRGLIRVVEGLVHRILVALAVLRCHEMPTAD